MHTELGDSFANALNASGKAVQAIVCFWLTLVIVILEGSAKAVRYFRAWILAGAKLPNWIFPRHERNV